MNKVRYLINQRGEEKRNILVACHNRQWLDEIPHWQKYFIETESKKIYPNDEIEYKTIDVLGNADIPNIDIFKYKPDNKIDILFLPDCGGLWYELQESKQTTFINYKQLITFLLENIVKVGGYLYVSKFLDKNVLKLLHMLFNTKHIDYYDENGIISCEYLVFHNIQPIENVDGNKHIMDIIRKIRKEGRQGLLYGLKFMNEI